MIKNMTRNDFMELFGLNENDDGMAYADELHNEGQSWFEIAKSEIATMNQLLLDD